MHGMGPWGYAEFGRIRGAVLRGALVSIDFAQQQHFCDGSALPKLKAYRHLDQHEETGFAWQHDRYLLSLPIGEHMDLDDCRSVIKAIKKVKV